MKAYGTTEEDGDQGVLTEKQRRVLDLLIENKTSKEIARTLGISPYTVDQRISLARGKLGVASRVELAARYRMMRKTSGRSTSDVLVGFDGGQPGGPHESGGPVSSGFDQHENPILSRARQRRGERTASIALDPHTKTCPTDSESDHRVGPEVFEGSSGALWRVGAIVATALLLVMMILGLFAIYNQLNNMLA